MQIHEITHRQINEILGTMAKAVGGALAQKAASTQGIDLDSQPDKVGVGQRQGAAMKMNAGLIQALAKKAQESWTTEVQNMIVKSEPKIMSASQIKLPTIELELQALINSLAGFDVTSLASAKDPSGQSQLTIKQLLQAKDEVVKATVAPKADPAAMSRAWNSLATMISQAQNVKAFVPAEAGGTQPAKITFDAQGKMLYNNKPFDARDQSHVMAQQLQAKAAPKT
jgi:hypothetical protein